MVDRKKFIFLHKILQRPNDHWTVKMLNHLKSQELGWAKNMTNKLREYGLEADYGTIKVRTKLQWRKEVEEAVNKRNLEILIDQCTHETPTESKINTKTKYIYDIFLLCSARKRHKV